jgi:hypothetical protein
MPRPLPCLPAARVPLGSTVCTHIKRIRGVLVWRAADRSTVVIASIENGQRVSREFHGALRVTILRNSRHNPEFTALKSKTLKEAV